MSKFLFTVLLLLGFSTFAVASSSGAVRLSRIKAARAQIHSFIPFLQDFPSASFQIKVDDEIFGVYVVRRHDGSYETRQLLNEDGSPDEETVLTGSLVYEDDGRTVLQWVGLDGTKTRIKMDRIFERADETNSTVNRRVLVEGKREYPNIQEALTFKGELVNTLPR